MFNRNLVLNVFMWEIETMHVAMCPDSGKKKWEVLAFISVDFLEAICRSWQGELDNCCNFDRPRSYLKLAIWRIAIGVLIDYYVHCCIFCKSLI